MAKEMIFLVEEEIEGGYAARALGLSVFTEADTMDELKINIQDAVRCHFGNNKKLHKINLLFSNK